MSKTIKLKKGFDINLVGKAEKKIAETSQPETFALKPDDFVGMQRPKMLVNEGDNVKAGTPIFHDKKNEQVMYCAPVSGEIVEIKRGEKRKILEVKILADKEVQYEEFNKYSVSDLNNLTREQAQEQLHKSGAWVNVIQRPFGIVADSNDSPKSIFISGFDSHPLAPDYGVLFNGQEQYIQAGIDVLSKFTEGTIHFNLRGNAEIPTASTFARNNTA